MNLPSGWRLQRLDVLAEVRLGRQRSPANHDGPNMRPYLRAANVGWSGLLLDDVKLMNFDDREMQSYRLQPGDILLAEASGSPGEVGKPALWNGEIQDCAFQNTLLRVRAHRADPQFLLHFFRFLALSGAFAGQSRGVGIHHLGQEALAAWQVPVPPIEEQRRIVEVLEDHLSRLDAAARLRASAESRAVAFRQAQLQRLIDTEGAKTGRLADLVLKVEAGKSFGTATRPAADGEWGIVRVSSMTWGEFRPEENKAVLGESQIDTRFEIRHGDILVSRANTPEYVGAPVFVRNPPRRLLLSDKSLRLVPRSGVHAEWLHRVLSAPRSRRQMTALATGTKESMRNISQASLLTIVVPIVDEQRQVDVTRAANELDQVMSRLSAALADVARKGHALRRALLASAFSGRLTEYTNAVAEELLRG